MFVQVAPGRMMEDLRMVRQQI
jgi:PAB1-binding protein PBP1